MNNDLISREALKANIKDNFNNEAYFTIKFIEAIDNAPTVEERPIRCKDCKHTILSDDEKTLICCLAMKCGTVRPNFYCGNGEMKGGAE